MWCTFVLVIIFTKECYHFLILFGKEYKTKLVVVHNLREMNKSKLTISKELTRFSARGIRDFYSLFDQIKRKWLRLEDLLVWI